MQTPQRLDRFDRPLQQYSPALSPIAPRIDDSRYHTHDIHSRLPGIAEDDMLYGSLDMSFSRDDVTALYPREDHRIMHVNEQSKNLFPVQKEGSVSTASHNNPSLHSQLEYSQNLNNNNNMGTNAVTNNDLRGSGESQLSKESDVGTISTTTSRNLFLEMNNLENNTNANFRNHSTLSEFNQVSNVASRYDDRNMLSTPVRRSGNISRMGDNTLASVSLLRDDNNQFDIGENKSVSLLRNDQNQHMNMASIDSKPTSIYQTPHKQTRNEQTRSTTPNSNSRNPNIRAVLDRSSSLLSSAEKRRENRAIINEIQHKYSKQSSSDADGHNDIMSEMRRSRELLEATKNYKSGITSNDTDRIESKTDIFTSNASNNGENNRSTQSVAMAVEDLLVRNDIYKTDHPSSQKQTPIQRHPFPETTVQSRTVMSTPITVPLTPAYSHSSNIYNNNGDVSSTNAKSTFAQSHSRSGGSSHVSQLAVTVTQPVTSTLPVGGVFCLIMTTDQQPVLVPLHQLSSSQQTSQPVHSSETQDDNNHNNVRDTHNNGDHYTKSQTDNDAPQSSNQMPLQYNRLRDPLGQSQSFLLRPAKSSVHKERRHNDESSSHHLHGFHSYHKPTLSERYDRYHRSSGGVQNHYSDNIEEEKHVHFAASPPKPSREIDDSNALLTSMSYFMDEPSILSQNLDTSDLMHFTGDGDKHAQETLVHRLTESRLRHDHNHMKQLQRSLTDPLESVSHAHYPRYHNSDLIEANVQEHFGSQQQQRLRQLFLQHYLPASATHTTSSEDVNIPGNFSSIHRVNHSSGSENVLPIAKVRKPLITHFPLRQSRENETVSSFLKRYTSSSGDFASTETKEHVQNDAQEMLDVSALSEDVEEVKGSQQWKQSLTMWRNKLAQTKLTTSLL